LGPAFSNQTQEPATASFPPKPQGLKPRRSGLSCGAAQAAPSHETTRTTSKPLESPRAARAGGSTAGKCRTSAGNHAGVRKTYSGDACAW